MVLSNKKSTIKKVIRSNIDPNLVYAIPNGISESFNPELVKSERQTDRIKVAISCRLEYRRGIDLLLGVIPEICQRFEDIDFIIIGDGPYRIKEGSVRETFAAFSNVKKDITILMALWVDMEALDRHALSA